MTIDSDRIQKALRPPFQVEFIAGISTFLTLSYVFVLNPILLHKAGIPLSAAFFGTVVSATIGTLLMGLWADVPFAVAPAPSITTFLVSFVCVRWGLPWPAALAAVFLSGALSVVMARLSIRQRLVASIPPPLGIGVLFALGGFLVANGLTQVKLVTYVDGFIDVTAFQFSSLLSANAAIFATGLIITLIFRQDWFRFSGAPLLGILFASIVALLSGIASSKPAVFSSEMFQAIGKIDFRPWANPQFLMAILIFFIIDFFGGVGKYIGLFKAMGERANEIPEKKLERSLYVDGYGNMIGAVCGASSLAVFVSSAVGIVAGGRTGRTAIVCAACMAASLFLMPLVGTVPVEATSGILAYVGIILIPWKQIWTKQEPLSSLDIVVSAAAAIIAFTTYSLDKAMLLVFLVYSALVIKRGVRKDDIILLVVTALLSLAVLSQFF